MSKRSKARTQTLREQMEGITRCRSLAKPRLIRRMPGWVFAIDATVGLITFAVAVITAGVAFGLI